MFHRPSVISSEIIIYFQRIIRTSIIYKFAELFNLKQRAVVLKLIQIAVLTLTACNPYIYLQNVCIYKFTFYISKKILFTTRTIICWYLVAAKINLFRNYTFVFAELYLCLAITVTTCYL